MIRIIIKYLMCLIIVVPLNFTYCPSIFVNQQTTIDIQNDQSAVITDTWYMSPPSGTMISRYLGNIKKEDVTLISFRIGNKEKALSYDNEDAKIYNNDVCTLVDEYNRFGHTQGCYLVFTPYEHITTFRLKYCIKGFVKEFKEGIGFSFPIVWQDTSMLPITSRVEIYGDMIDKEFDYHVTGPVKQIQQSDHSIIISYKHFSVYDSYMYFISYENGESSFKNFKSILNSYDQTNNFRLKKELGLQHIFNIGEFIIIELAVYIFVPILMIGLWEWLVSVIKKGTAYNDRLE